MRIGRVINRLNNNFITILGRADSDIPSEVRTYSNIQTPAQAMRRYFAETRRDNPDMTPMPYKIMVKKFS